jgi:hypothetical protein
MKCQICGAEVTKNNNGFSDLLNNEEKKRVLNLKPEQTVCCECKFTVMALDIISPFRG